MISVSPVLFKPPIFQKVDGRVKLLVYVLYPVLLLPVNSVRST